MHVLMLSWEFPPLVVGGIARHVHDLAVSLAREGAQVTILTAGGAQAKPVEHLDGITVHRVLPANPTPLDLTGHIMQLNLNLLERGLSLAAQGEVFDLVHAHDWVTAYAGKALKHGLDLPLLATIHATEWGRNNGLHNDLQRYISSIEWWLCFEAWRVICCSRYMAGELRQVFQLPEDKLRTIVNGVYPEEFTSGPIPAGFRERYAAPDEKILFHVGRLVREKGLDILLDALPQILMGYPRVKLIIAGRGGYEAELKARAERLGIYHRVYFTGYIDDQTRNLLYRLADAAVFPSLYEPFGIVALEAMAANVPPVVSDTGGLSEVVVHGRNGLKVQTGNAGSLAENVLWMLNHPDKVAEMRAAAGQDVRRLYNWRDIAHETRRVYEEVLAENRQFQQKGRPAIAPWKLTEMEAPNRYSRAMG
ncbi:MAG: glycosyltransferase family 4 protein [Bacteroidota bacterium]